MGNKEDFYDNNINKLDTQGGRVFSAAAEVFRTVICLSDDSVREVV